MLNIIPNTRNSNSLNFWGTILFGCKERKDVARIIEIFSIYPLNTHKHLNFYTLKVMSFIQVLRKPLELIK